MNGSPLRFAGYAALFDVADGANDTLRRGAFERTLARREGLFPLYWQHRADRQIGLVEQIGEDSRGLRVIARLHDTNNRAAALLRAGQVNGLSFGYRTRRARTSQTGRELLEVELFEVSLVHHPLQGRARVHLIAG